MSYLPAISTINSTSLSNDLAFGYALKHPEKKLPRWLLEFNDFNNKDNQVSQKQEQSLQSRPLTESHLLGRPRWFEELSQKRRMSDISNLNFTNSAELLVESQVNHDLGTNREVSSSEHQNGLKLPSERELKMLPSEPLSLSENNYAFAMSDSKRDSRSSSKHSPRSISDFMLEDKMFEMSTTKSIENLRIDLEEFSNRSLPMLDAECIIPEMPSGNELTFLLIDNWGDENFIGINGIEIFDHHGQQPSIKNIYLEDSRENRLQMGDLKKLIDGVYRTHDDAHIWQYHITKKHFPLRIVLQFEKSVKIALIRVWNYNKSRIHSYRGVKLLHIKLNDQTIFCGEIAKATGNLTGSVENFGDTILFTTNDNILEEISQHDISFQQLLMEQMHN